MKWFSILIALGRLLTVQGFYSTDVQLTKHQAKKNRFNQRGALWLGVSRVASMVNINDSNICLARPNRNGCLKHEAFPTLLFDALFF